MPGQNSKLRQPLSVAGPGSSHGPQTARVDPSSPIFADTRALAKALSRDYLASLLDSLADEEATVEARWADVADSIVRRNTIEYDRFAIGERLRAVTDELSLRDRANRLTPAQRAAGDREHAAWRDLARVVRERTDIVEVLRAAGYQLRKASRNARSGGREWCGPCPLCGGTKRFRVWDGPNGRAWCRECRWSVDVIGITQSIVPGCENFRDAVRTLAEAVLAKEVPD